MTTRLYQTFLLLLLLVATNIAHPSGKNPLNKTLPHLRPDFFVLGTRKGGTTSFITYISKHPKVYPLKIQGTPQDGEIPGFLGTVKYEKMFEGVPRGMLVGDSSVSRLVNDAHSLASHYPRTPMFVLLRDPVERCASQFKMRARLHAAGVDEHSNLTRLIEQEVDIFERTFLNHEGATQTPKHFPSSKNCMYEGVYSVHLSRLFRAGVHRSNVKIYWSESFFENTTSVMTDVLRFLGLDPSLLDVNVYKGRYNMAPDSLTDISTSLKKRMYDLYKPFDEGLEKLLGETPPWFRNNKVGIS